MSNQIPEIVSNITDDVRSIVADEIALLKAEIKPAVRHIGLGGGLIGAAGYFVVSATIIFWFTMAAGFGWLYATTTGLSGWACGFFGALSAMIVLLIGAVVLAWSGKVSLSAVKAPEKAPATITAALAAVRTGIADGQTKVAAELRSPKGSEPIHVPVGGRGEI